MNKSMIFFSLDSFKNKLLVVFHILYLNFCCNFFATFLLNIITLFSYENFKVYFKLTIKKALLESYLNKNT